MKVILVVLLAGILAPAEEPTSAMLKGRVVDGLGDPIPGALIQVKRTGSDEAASTVSDGQGAYTLRLTPGVYDMSVEFHHFATFAREGLRLEYAQVTNVDVEMTIAPLEEQVTITAKAPPRESVFEAETEPFQSLLEIREVRESSAKDVGEALSKMDGLWKVRKGGIANDVVLRGFQQDNLTVLVDGTRVYGACPNDMDPPVFHVDFSEIQQVEVTKGPFDITNQGGFGGTIRVQNKQPEPGFRVTPSLSAGSFGYFNPSVAVSLAGDRMYGLGGYSYRRSDPFVDGSGRQFTAYANYREDSKDSSAFDINTAWLKFGAATAENQRLQLAYSRQASDEVLYPYLLMDGIYDNADRWQASYLINGLSGTVKGLRFESYFTRVNHWMTDEHRLSSAGAARPYGMATSAGTKALGGRVEAELAQFTVGFEGYRRYWNAVTTMRMSGMYMDQPSMPDVSMLVGGLYGQYRATLPRGLRLTVGGRLDGADSEARSQTLNTDLYWAYKNTRSTTSTDLEPSASAWLATPLRPDLELFLGVGHAARFPDPQERYFALRRMGTDWVGDPGLRPTRNTEGDLGLRYRVRRFSVSPVLFWSWLEDYIVVHNQPRMNNVPGVTNAAARSFANARARIFGGELGYSVGLSPAFLLSGGISYARGTKDQADPARRIFDLDLAQMPPLRSRTSLRYGGRLFFFEVEGLVCSRQDHIDSDLLEAETAGFAVMNASAGMHGRKLKFAVGVDNVFDRFYVEHFSYQRYPFRSGARIPEPGRTIFATVSRDF